MPAKHLQHQLRVAPVLVDLLKAYDLAGDAMYAMAGLGLADRVHEDGCGVNDMARKRMRRRHQ